MDRVLWMTRDYLLMRKQFKQPIGNFQALQHRMADMLIELELSRSVLYRALSRLGSPVDERDHAVSLAKVQIGKAAKFVGGQAIQLHGAIGVTEECAVGHYFRRLTLIDNSFGSVQNHLQRIAAHFQKAA
jgi:alkylation response protein AidB-like acyl-CoA dehydrogenase